ncbi:MAG: hypothetical protein Q7U71_08550 [bacterium]|nr:hypothetical protein [bacterium]
MRARVLTLIVLLAMSAAAVAQVQTYPWYNSFRNQSTSGLLEDDLDLMLGSYGYLDPARMTLIDGGRLYTNLSNIYSQYEEVFDNNGDDTYVIGGTSDIFGYGKLGLVYSQNTDKYRDSTAYEYIYLEETNGANPGYDFKAVDKYQYQYQDTQDEKDYFLGWAKQVNDMKLGVAFKREQYSYMQDEFNKYDYTEQNLVTGQTIYTQAEQDTSSNGYNESTNYVGASVWKPLNDKMDVSLRLAVGFGGGKNIDEYDYSWDENYPGGDSYNETEDHNYTTEYTGFAFSGGGAYVYKWSDKVDTRLDLQYSHMSNKPKAGTTWEENYHEQTLSLTSEYYDEGYTGTLEGENADNNIDFRMVSKARLNKAVFAIGFGLSTGNYDQTSTIDEANTSVYRYSDQNIDTLPTSYVETSTWNEQWEYMNTGSYLTWSFPVCVEFDLTKSIVFRLGARHEINNGSYTNNNTLTGGSDMTTVVTRYGNGYTTTDFYPDPLDEQTGYTNTYNYRNSYTDYTYGAGWKVTENLQLDFMGFAQLNDLTNWKLSAVFKF